MICYKYKIQKYLLVFHEVHRIRGTIATVRRIKINKFVDDTPPSMVGCVNIIVSAVSLMGDGVTKKNLMPKFSTKFMCDV